jgi:hypothetical protein
MMDPGRRCPCSCWQRGRSPACGPHPAIPPPRQPFRSRTSHYQPSPAAQSSSASPPAPRRPACRVSAAYHAALARGGAQRRAGSCGRPGRWGPPFLCPASAGGRARTPVALQAAHFPVAEVASMPIPDDWRSGSVRLGAPGEKRQAIALCRHGAMNVRYVSQLHAALNLDRPSAWLLPLAPVTRLANSVGTYGTVNTSHINSPSLWVHWRARRRQRRSAGAPTWYQTLRKF